jgi:hypothetical protein
LWESNGGEVRHCAVVSEKSIPIWLAEGRAFVEEFGVESRVPYFTVADVGEEREAMVAWKSEDV